MFFRPDDWWLTLYNRVYLWSGVATLFAGFITIIATRGIQVYSGRIDSAQKQHIAEMELQTAQAKRDATEAGNKAADAHVKIADAQVLMEQARSDAATAVEGQKSLEVEAEHARTRQKELDAEVAKSRVQQEELRKQNLELQSRVEQERIARLEIEERLAPRTLTEAQAALISRTVSSIAKQSVIVTAPLGLPEPIFFSQAIKTALENGGWTVNGVNQGVFAPSVPSGIYVRIKDRNAVPPAAEVLIRALSLAGFKVVGEQLPTIQANDVELLIGTKP